MRTGGRSLLEFTETETKCDKEEEEEAEADEEVRAEGKEEKPWAVREGFTQRPEADERKADAGVAGLSE